MPTYINPNAVKDHSITSVKLADNVIPTDASIAAMGYTKNAGTITGIIMNGTSKGTSGVVDLGTVITDASSAQPDWNQDTSTSGDYIKNKPFVKAGTGAYSVIEGDFQWNTARGAYSHAEGNSTDASGNYSHTEGGDTKAFGDYCHVEGYGAQAGYDWDGGQISTPTAAHAEGCAVAEGDYSHAEGGGSAYGESSHAEGVNTHAEGNYSHSEGSNGYAYGESSHSEGEECIAQSDYSHAEGYWTTAGSSGDYEASAAHSEGYSTHANGEASHSEGYYCTADGGHCHAEGYYTVAGGGHAVDDWVAAHAEGYETQAAGYYSHTEGFYTRTNNEAEHAEGAYNVSHTGDASTKQSLSTIGIGVQDSNDRKRKNAVEVMKNGDMYVYGVGNYDGSNYINASTLQEVVNNSGGGASGTLNTTATTAQSTNASESLSGSVTLHKVAKTGTYSDLIGKPTIPTVNNATLTIQKNGTNVQTFTANASSNVTANITVNELPTVTSSDNGKVLMVVNGAWSMVTPVSIYSGSGAPDNTQGINGDIYLQV